MIFINILGKERDVYRKGYCKNRGDVDKIQVVQAMYLANFEMWFCNKAKGDYIL